MASLLLYFTPMTIKRWTRPLPLTTNKYEVFSGRRRIRLENRIARILTNTAHFFLASSHFRPSGPCWHPQVEMALFTSFFQLARTTKWPCARPAGQRWNGRLLEPVGGAAEPPIFILRESEALDYLIGQGIRQSSFADVGFFIYPFLHAGCEGCAGRHSTHPALYIE